MNKNILAFLNKYYITYTIPNLILRIIGLFLISYAIIIYVEIYSPYGYDSVSFFSKMALPYTIALTITTTLISISFILLYLNRKQWKLVLMRGLTNIYISVLFLVASFLNFNGYELSLANINIIIFEIIIYLLVIPIEVFIIVKFIIPKGRKDNENQSKYILIIISVCAFRLVLTTSKEVNIQEILTVLAYFLSLTLLVNSIYFFMQSYYSKKYSINTINNTSSSLPPRTLHNL